MGNFQLDTSGEVVLKSGDWGDALVCLWSDLLPFAQRYMEAMASATSVAREHGWFTHQWVLPIGDTFKVCAFSDLAPETLARIMRDCAEAAHPRATKRDGQNFWIMRRIGSFPSFPPLTVYLGDDGLIRFREVA